MKSFFSKIFSKTENLKTNSGEIKTKSTSNNVVKRAGDIKVNAFFCVSQTNIDKKKNEILIKESMGTFSITILPTNNDAEIIWKAVRGITNDLLENYLEKNGLLQFIPFHRPTYDWKGDVLEAGSEMEIYYYHDKDFYEQKFKSYGEGYIMQNHDPSVLKILEDLCKFYSLDPAKYL
jgi:hypothetical protein